jgi:hypothetical protein
MTRFGKTVATLAALAIAGTAIYAGGALPKIQSIRIPTASPPPTNTNAPATNKNSILRRNARGNICQLGEDCRPDEVEGLAPLSKIGGDR